MFLGGCSENDICDINSSSKDAKDPTSHLTKEQLKFRAECAPLHSLELDYLTSVTRIGDTRQAMLKANQQGDVFNVNSMITDAVGAFVPQKRYHKLLRYNR